MRFSRYLRCAAAAFTIAGLAACAATSPQTIPGRAFDSAQTGVRATVSFRAIGLPASFVPYAIMKDGSIAGSDGTAAAIYRRGEVTVLGRFQGEQTVATSVNSAGEAVGYSTPSDGSASHALEFEDGKIDDLGHVPNARFGYPETINDSGEIYGEATTRTLSDGRYLARFRPGTPQRIFGCLDGRGQIYNVNDGGSFSVTGYVFQTDYENACRGTGVALQKLFPQYSWSTASWVNDAGTITGSLSKAANHPWYPRFAYTYDKDGAVSVLPSLTGADDMEPSAIDAAGEVVGMAYKSTDVNYARVFLYNGRTTLDITESISPKARYIVSVPGFSNAREFVAAAHHGGTVRYYLIAPSAQP